MEKYGESEDELERYFRVRRLGRDVSLNLPLSKPTAQSLAVFRVQHSRFSQASMHRACLRKQYTLLQLWHKHAVTTLRPATFCRASSYGTKPLGQPPIMTSDSNGPSDELSTLSHSDLIARITTLESQLRTSQHLLSQSLNRQILSSSPPVQQSVKPPHRPFSLHNHSTRHIALKFAYIGSHYNGYEHANNTVTPKPTVEEVLWKALRKARLIAPDLKEGCDEGMEVVWEDRERRRIYGYSDGEGKGEAEVGRKGKVRLEVNWEGCQYSKCGRTDRGVSAFGQVVGVRVRSKRPRAKETVVNGVDGVEGEKIGGSSKGADLDEMPDIAASELDEEAYEKPFDDVKDELPYVTLLNSILPPSLRVLAWCPHPPADFDARFSCRERRYKYFFTNPAFCPKPGSRGMAYADGRSSKLREGWLDIDRMKIAAKKLEGLHDFRNLCKIDPSKQMTSCERRVRYASVDEAEAIGAEFSRGAELNAFGIPGASLAGEMGTGDLVHEGPKLYTFTVHGTAFLWHQVRCMVAILFLVGQGLEEPEVIDKLLDIKNNPRRPAYEMADDSPLVLWDCVFTVEDGGEDALAWIYAGDEASLPALAVKGDGKFNFAGTVGLLWSEWRKAKIAEALAGSLLDLALKQGDGLALHRGGFRDPDHVQVSQRVFDGSDSARIAGKYTPVMEKPSIASLAEQNDRWLHGRKVRRDAKKIPQVDDDQ